MNNKGQVWVSAVLYIALGMIIITLILSAGIPLIDKMRDKNTIIQTKRLLFNLNSNIEAVANEGAGSKRYISPFEIGGGVLNLELDKEILIWKMTTKTVMMEPTELGFVEPCSKINSEDCPGLEIFKEGALNMWMIETGVEDEYDIYLELKYKTGDSTYLDLKVSDPNQVTTLVGKYSLSIEHKGFVGDTPIIGVGVI